MNKRIFSALVLAGMIASATAFAENAREEVLGQGGASIISDKGSFYYESSHNMFYNPSYVNDFKNWAAFEKGTAGNAEFGFASSMMNMNMGLYFNRFGGTQNITSGANASVIDLLIGGDMGVKWGLGLNYGKGVAAAQNFQNHMGATLGAQINGFDPFVGFTLSSEDKTSAGTKVTTYKGMNAGLRYHFGEWTPFAAINNTSSKVEATAVETKTSKYTVGVGREAKLAEGARLVYALFYQHTGVKIADIKQPNSSVASLPMNVGVEADALSWMTVRAGAAQTLIGTGSNKQTTAKVGATFHIAKVDVDYAFGNLVNGAGTVTSDSPDVGFDSGTFHKVGMKYSW